MAAHSYMKKEFGPDVSEWKWAAVHTTDYQNLPWSKTNLRSIWHREVPTSGNGNTPGISKYSLVRANKEGKFRGTGVGGLKVLYAHGFGDFWSIDAGINGNILAGHYFDFNEDHLLGNLK